MTNPRDRLDRARREEIIRAGWEGDKALRADLGSYEAATWEIGACARDPQRVHPYNQSTWQADIDAYRKKWSTPIPGVSAPVVDLAEIERLVDEYGEKSYSAGWDGQEGENRLCAAEQRTALLTAIRQLVSAPVSVPAELRELSEKVPPGPWIAGPYGDVWIGISRNASGKWVEVPGLDPTILAGCSTLGSHENDIQTFIANAVNHIRALIATEDARQLAARTADHQHDWMDLTNKNVQNSKACKICGLLPPASDEELAALNAVRTAPASDAGSDDARAQPHVCPDGWRCVPKYPTALMKEAGHHYAYGKSRDCAHEVYAQMLAAAPHPPVGEKAAADATTMGER